MNYNNSTSTTTARAQQQRENNNSASTTTAHLVLRVVVYDVEHFARLELERRLGDEPTGRALVSMDTIPLISPSLTHSAAHP